jgi:hypothetical protein
MLGRFFLLSDRAQNIARAGDVRQINLGLDFFFAVRKRARRTGGTCTRFSVSTKTLADQLSFVFFQ